MAGIALLLDLLKKQSFSSQTLHSCGLFSATVAASAAAASVAAGTPFASRFLFGDGGLSVTLCDASASWTEDYISKLRAGSDYFFQRETLNCNTKDYPIEVKPLFSAFGVRSLGLTTLRSLLMFYLPLLEPKSISEEDDLDFLEEPHEKEPVDLVAPLKKSAKQIIRETTVVTTRRVLERLAVHYVSQRMAWKLLKVLADIPKSAKRKAARGMPSTWFFYSVTRSTFRGHLLGVAASWLIQVGIEIYRFFSCVATDDKEAVDKVELVKLLHKKISAATIRCGASLVFASIGAGIGATVFHPSIGQWFGCAAGDLAGPIIVAFCFEKIPFLDL